MKSIAHALLALSVGWSPWLYANGDASLCQPQGFIELIRCAEKTSAEIQIAEQKLKSAQTLDEIAQQWVNPELDADHLAKGSEKSETNAALLFTLRLGGKKSALFEEASSEVNKAEAQRDLSVQQTRLEIMLSAYRLSHLKSEIEIEEESVTTFSKIIQQFQKRPALSPEQDVSLAVFRMALADHQLRLTKLNADQKKLSQMLAVVMGIPQSVIVKNLPTRKSQWSELTMTAELESSPQIRQAQAELKFVQSQKAIAESEAWPDLKIGPSVRATKENGESETFVGFGLSMSLPIFTQNSGARANSKLKVTEAQLELEQTRRKIFTTKSELLSRYNQTVQSLKNTLSFKVLNDNHAKVERQFFKGLVSSSLVIEAHRQLYELEERRNASELEALEAYGQLLILENRFAEVIL